MKIYSIEFRIKDSNMLKYQDKNEWSIWSNHYTRAERAKSLKWLRKDYKNMYEFREMETIGNF